MKNIKKLNLKAIIESVYFLDGEKYIKDRLNKLLTSEIKDCGFLPDEPTTRIISWVDSDLEGIVLYIPADQRAYMTTI